MISTDDSKMQRVGSSKGNSELRRVARKPVTLWVELKKDNGTVQTCMAKDVGLGGIFLLTSPTYFHINEIVNLDVWLNFNGLHKRCRIVARVVRVAGNGIGVGFHRYDSPFFRYVYKMMYENSIHEVLPLYISYTADNDDDSIVALQTN